MAGVKPISVGPGSVAGCPALVGRAERIWCPSQSAVFIHNGSRLGRCGERAPVGSVQRKTMDLPGDFRNRFPVVDRILGRTDIFRIAEGKLIICVDCIYFVVGSDVGQCLQPQDQRIFLQKRGT